MKIGVVADDITGANDIGSMFAKAGYRVHVYLWDRFDSASLAGEQPDVCIIDTSSRLDAPDVAYGKVAAATQHLQQAGCRQFFNKTCSVFRGNIGAEFDAMLDRLDETFAVVVLGFPKNGRLTIDGVHYVHGQLLEESPFRHDPIHPMTRSNLVAILQAQTRRAVALVDHRLIAQGADALRGQVAALRGRCHYLILDVPDQAALRTIAQAVGEQRVLCGSSALAEELPAVWGPPAPARQPEALPSFGSRRVLGAAGSLTPQTIAQIDHLRARGTPLVEVNTVALFDAQERQAEIAQAVALLAAHTARGADPLVYAANRPEIVASTRAEGARAGLLATEVARVVEETLAEIVACTLERTDGRRVVVAGGETSAAICRRLGIGGVRIWQEIQPGLPSCISLTERPLLLVLKSGSFGTADFLELAVDQLTRIEPLPAHDP
ncbi:MAG TPA: four-carbon acid sugar kinase family protein [Herpetosiphonaceae bacterium]